MSTETLDAPEIEVIDAPKLSAAMVYAAIAHLGDVLEKHEAA